MPQQTPTLRVERPTLRVVAAEGRHVFALRENGRPEIPTRQVGCDAAGAPLPDGEVIAARRTADGRLVPALHAYRTALVAGDIAEAPAPNPEAPAAHEAAPVAHDVAPSPTHDSTPTAEEKAE